MSDGIPSPSPDFPQQIKNVTGQANVKIQNKNLFTSEWVQGEINSTTGIIGPSNTSIATDNFIEVKPNTRYSMSRTIATAYMNVRGYDENKNYIGTGNSGKVITTIIGSSNANPMQANEDFCVIEIKENIHYLKFNDLSNDLSTKYMMVEGQYTAETIPSYVAHQEQNLPFTLGDIELNKIDTAQDYFYKENNKWYLHKEIGSKKSNFNWKRGADYNPDVYYSTEIDDYEISNNIPLCNYFQGIENVSSESIMVGKTNQIAFRADRNYIRLYVNTSLTAEQLNALDLELYYKLYQPTNTEITDTTLIGQLEAIKQAKSYDDITIISSESDELEFKMDVEILSNGVSSSNTRTLALGSLNKGSLNNIKEVDTEDTEDETSVESEE